MAHYDVQAVIHHESGLPKDDVVNVLHFEINAPDTVAGTLDDVAAAYATLNTYLASSANGLTLKAYEEGPNPGGPVVEKNYALAGNQAGGPPQIACCLSYATVDTPEASTPRRRGRIYLGPFQGTATNADRPSSFLRTAILDFGAALAAAGNAGNTTWLMRSQADNAYAKIESIWVDDTWDTQRRRSNRPTLRDKRDVQ